MPLPNGRSIPVNISQPNDEHGDDSEAPDLKSLASDISNSFNSVFSANSIDVRGMLSDMKNTSERAMVDAVTQSRADTSTGNQAPDLINAVNELITVTKDQSNYTGNAALVASIETLINNAKDQLEKQDEMLRAMQDTKDYTQRLFDVMS